MCDRLCFSLRQLNMVGVRSDVAESVLSRYSLPASKPYSEPNDGPAGVVRHLPTSIPHCTHARKKPVLSCVLFVLRFRSIAGSLLHLYYHALAVWLLRGYYTKMQVVSDPISIEAIYKNLYPQSNFLVPRRITHPIHCSKLINQSSTKSLYAQTDSLGESKRSLQPYHRHLPTSRQRHHGTAHLPFNPSIHLP